MKIKEVIYFLIGIVFVTLGLIDGATAFSAICYTNTILILILLEISSINTGLSSKEKNNG